MKEDITTLLLKIEEQYENASKAAVHSAIKGDSKMNFYNSGAAAAFKTVMNELEVLLSKTEKEGV